MVSSDSNSSVQNMLGLSVQGLTVSRSEQVLFEDIDFHLQPKTITYLYGENGAGKTSLLRALAGLLTIDSGSIVWNGLKLADPEAQYHKDLIFLAHALAMKSELTIVENLEFYARLRGVTNASQKIQQATSELALDEILDRRFSELSAGQQHKVCLCRLVIEPAKLWILDEPFVNLDNKTRSWLAHKVDLFAQQGGAVIFTSHQEITELAIHQKISLQHSENDGVLA